MDGSLLSSKNHSAWAPFCSKSYYFDLFLTTSEIYCNRIKPTNSAVLYSNFVWSQNKRLKAFSLSQIKGCFDMKVKKILHTLFPLRLRTSSEFPILWYRICAYRLVGQAVMRTSLEREIWGSNLGPVKSDKVLPTARHRCDISLKGAVLPRRNGAEMAPQTRYTLRRKVASIIKNLICVLCICVLTTKTV